MKNALFSALVSTLLIQAASAAPIQFDFKDPKGVNNVVFSLDAPLEAITGSATGVSGTVSFDPEKPGDVKGKLVIAASSMHVGNTTMQEHMHSDQWLDVAKNPEISFVAEKAENVKTTGNETTADVTGKFTLKGVTKTVTIPVKMSYLKDKLKARFPKFEGDLLVIRSNFKIKRSDFGIKPGMMEDKVADQIELSMSVAGMAPKAPKAS